MSDSTLRGNMDGYGNGYTKGVYKYFCQGSNHKSSIATYKLWLRDILEINWELKLFKIKSYRKFLLKNGQICEWH